MNERLTHAFLVAEGLGKASRGKGEAEVGGKECILCGVCVRDRGRA
jgi:hypothetical protein